MTRIKERLELPAAPALWEHLNRAICQVSPYQQPDSARLRVPLVPVTGGPALEKEVIVTYDSEERKAKDEPWKLRWKPAEGGPYPDFEGRLTLRNADGESPFLELEGEYVPPLGAAGEAFDAVIGSRIAAVTAREFLRSIAEQIQHQYTVDKALNL